jgi:SNF2 family DNA or RNA helicase
MASLYENKMNGILADDMGLGKTIMAISIICYILETQDVIGEPHLIVGPKSTMSNWMKEFTRWAPHLRTVNLQATQEERVEILKNQMQ